MNKDLNKIADDVKKLADQLGALVELGAYLKEIKSFQSAYDLAVKNKEFAEVELGLAQKELGNKASEVHQANEAILKMKHEASVECKHLISDAKAEASGIVADANNKLIAIKQELLDHRSQIGQLESQIIAKSSELKELQDSINQIKKNLGTLLG
jgi:chromosome segregation ATPase